MRLDYHMHFEHGSYDAAWVQGFFDAAEKRGIDEIGISEHSHGFEEFEPFYYNDLVLDDSFIGEFQQKWLKKKKFMYSLEEYFDFMEQLKSAGHDVKTGIEVCNFQQQVAVKNILCRYPFDYIIGSVHFLRGWAYDSAEIKAEWNEHSLEEIYEWYTAEAEYLCAGGCYDVLGHPFNIRLFKFIPDFDVTPYLQRVAKAMKKADMVVDVNTGTLYRYPIKEISPYPDFMEMAAEYHLPISFGSDAHEPEDCGAYISDAVDYVKKYGYRESVRFDKRDREMVLFD